MRHVSELWGLWLFCFPFYLHPASLAHADAAGVFASVLDLHGRAMPSPLTADWWIGNCDKIDVTTARLCCMWELLNHTKRHKGATASSWWPQLLDASIEMLKMNSLAGLSGRDTMCFGVVASPVALVELAAHDESQHSLLFASGVMEALEYGIMHDFTVIGISVSAYAAGAAVALVGKREGGRTLSREAVFAVLKRLHGFFTQGSSWAGAPVKTVMPHFQRIVTLSISDANKKHMLQFEPLVDILLECLLLDGATQTRPGGP